MKFCIIHDYMLLNFIEESLSTPDVPGATKRSCIPHCWSENDNINPSKSHLCNMTLCFKNKRNKLQKDDRENLQTIELQALTPGGERGRSLLHIVCNNWKSIITSCFFFFFSCSTLNWLLYECNDVVTVFPCISHIV